mmetsp:Transcript_34661/g.58084  ORF Transcript_34661/g.58084 Transcript_34661/m.58084 type:complete len:460 (-) Transcript_34661:203-1582(-)|eukprot:CAMPEP_0184345218 /NCGR_PEP_ID=MMETSP1089-20130417/13637_1 /TAXON_ID=38269 ORGANISM="Gloeochaete wittrockiana, Strain SAG46.84" /NCGR_SAMPLE_ID=MMETSP1089 /ASSEMBLY_ACC=CAM_ASM_000445 /LENGTH=459 /DNA_ID=CAMNT_0026675429 /DNA_START=73 /DNA_END=1452 /DNA_ORIENTATION=+
MTVIEPVEEVSVKKKFKSFFSGIFGAKDLPLSNLAFLDYGVTSRQGPRPHQEDRYIMKKFLMPSSGGSHSFVGVFDGHGGFECAEYITDHLYLALFRRPEFNKSIAEAIRAAVREVDTEFLKMASQSALIAGSTGVFAVIDGDSIIVGNIGDSRCVMSRRGIAVELSKDQKPYRPDELQRIQKAGGWLDANGLLNGYISMSRSFGDIGMKDFKALMFPGANLAEDVFICEPEIVEIEITPKDEFLILASDGLWGRVSSKAAVKIARESLRKNADPQKAADALAEAAYAKGSLDNCTVLVVIISTAGLQYSGASMNSVTMGPSVKGGKVSSESPPPPALVASISDASTPNSDKEEDATPDSSPDIGQEGRSLRGGDMISVVRTMSWVDKLNLSDDDSMGDPATKPPVASVGPGGAPSVDLKKLGDWSDKKMAAETPPVTSVFKPTTPKTPKSLRKGSAGK